MFVNSLEDRIFHSIVSIEKLDKMVFWEGRTFKMSHIENVRDNDAHQMEIISVRQRFKWHLNVFCYWTLDKSSK